MKHSLKFLIFLTIIVSLLATFIPSLYALLSLSWSGIEHLYLWQLITYLFVEAPRLSFSFFLQLGVNMYLLWLFGGSILERSRPPLLLALYLGAGLFAALCVLGLPHPKLAGSIPSIYALLIAWIMLNPGSQLLLFFALPFKAHFLLLALIGVNLFLDITSADWNGSVSLIASVVYGYLFTLIAFRQSGPFAILRPFEKRVLRLLEGKKTLYRPTKIYDIHSGKPVLSDEEFMNAMLDRISLYGETSLTPEEKERMKQISERKKRK